MKRNKHNLSHYNLLTCDMGEMVPVNFTEVLPGDSFQGNTSVFLRASPLIAPIMHPVSVRVHHWFVPYRILWNEWEDFITGGPDGTGSQNPLPTLTTTVTAGSPLDYLGIPPTTNPQEILSFPLEAYNLIYNEWYRDQDINPKRTNLDETMARIAWEKDYLTAARPWPQKGPEVLLPLGETASVVSADPGVAGPTWTTPADSADNQFFITPGTGQSVTAQGTYTAGGGAIWGSDTGLEADLSSATAASITDLRQAMAIQRYQEARSRYGSRYTEYLRYLGVRSSDARLQRPEFLGGGKSVIAFSEVLNTTSAIDDPDSTLDDLGRMGGHGIAAMKTRPYRRFFEEHGCVISIMSVRPRAMYTQGIHRSWLRRTKEDFWQKELEHIGQQETKTREVYADAATEVFGYHDRYREYRETPNRISADFRSTLDFWHLGRSFASEPVLNQSFIDCNPSKRIFAEQTADSLWCMVKNNIVARRLVARNASPRIY